jgi:hypothetical protein
MPLMKSLPYPCCRAVSCRAPRSRWREVLEHVVERDVVVAERPAVDLEDQRIFFDASKRGGFTIQPCTFALPDEV